MLKKTFGIKKENEVYLEREGCYGIGFLGDGKVAVVKNIRKNGDEAYFLIGGGIEEGENHIECLKREFLEEAGLTLTVKELICEADYYTKIKDENLYFHPMGYFYYIEIGEKVSEPLEENHYLVFLDINEAREKIFLPQQLWALEEAYKRYKK